tara:strand:- start:18 stop:1154 length:1137 start_codon:yes stop_codon:yes gene_type:complete
MQAKKTLLAIALGVVAHGAHADVFSEGDLYADAKVRFETSDVDDANDAKTANALIADVAIGYETKDFSGFKVLAEYEVVEAMKNHYAPESAGFDVVADPETREWNRAQISYKKDGFGAVMGRQRIILDGARFVGNVGWRSNEQTFDAATLTYKKDGLSLHYSFIDQVNGILPKFDADTSHHLVNAGYKVGSGKISTYAYLLEDDDSDATLDTYGASYKGSTMADDVKVIYSAEYATQSTDDFDATYYAVEGGAVISGVTLALGNETLGSDDGAYGFQTPLATKHKFNGWADKFLKTPASGLSDTYVKAVTKVNGVKLVGFYRMFDAVEGSADLGSELDLLAVKKLDDTFTVGAKAAFYNAGDTGVDTTKMWAWVQAKF